MKAPGQVFHDFAIVAIPIAIMIVPIWHHIHLPRTEPRRWKAWVLGAATVAAALSTTLIGVPVMGALGTATFVVLAFAFPPNPVRCPSCRRVLPLVDAEPCTFCPYCGKPVEGIQGKDKGPPSDPLLE